jgi:hypothetical protein
MSLDGAVTFPEREGVYPIGRAFGGTWIYVPDGFMSLALLDDGPSMGRAVHPPSFWADGWLRSQPVWWHLFEPRDPEGSRALAGCTLEQAGDLLRAARSVVRLAADHGREVTDLSKHYKDMRVTMTAPTKEVDPTEENPGLADAVRTVFPDVTHGRLRKGVVAIASLAVDTSRRLVELQTKVRESAATRQSGMTNRDVLRLDGFFEAGFSVPGRWGQDRLGQQIEDVAAFLFGDRPTPLHRPSVVTPAPCFVAWERTLFHGQELLLILLRAPVPETVRAEVRRFLELYRATPFATQGERVRVMGLSFTDSFAPDLTLERPDRLVEWDNRYFLRCKGFGGGGRPWAFSAVEVAGAKGFRLPPGATLGWQRDEPPLAAAAIDQAFRLLDTRGPVPVDPEVARSLAESTGLLEIAAARMANGCFWIEPEKAGRAALGTTVGRLQHGKIDLDLPRTDYHPLIAGAVPENLEELYAPRLPGRDGMSFVGRLASRWNAAAGRREPISIDLVEQLEEQLRQPRPPFVEAARALREPESVPGLTRDAAWVHRPFKGLTPDAVRFGSVPAGWPQHADEPTTGWARQWPDRAAFSYDALTHYVKYLSWAYLERPVGDAIRRSAARMAGLIRARLAAPDHLLPLAMGPNPGGDTSIFRAFYGALGGEAYVAADGGPSARGKEADALVCVIADGPGDASGGFFSVRTRSLATLADLDRVLARLRATEPLTHFPFQETLRLWLSPRFQALVADLDRPAAEIGQFVANPMVSGPEAVAAVSKAHDLSQDAASLWLQLQILPEPTQERVVRYNHWNRDRYATAAGSLLARKLIVEAAPRGTSRTHFLPGPLAYFDRYPGPVETCKLAQLGLVEGEVPPLTVPLPIGLLSWAL